MNIQAPTYIQTATESTFKPVTGWLCFTNDLIWAVRFKAQLSALSRPRMRSKVVLHTIHSYKNIFGQLENEKCLIGKVDGAGFQTAGIIATANAQIYLSAMQQNTSELPDLAATIAALSDDSLSDKQPEVDFTLFYDGGCPLCSREVKWVRQYTGERVAYVDIATADFKPELIGEDLDLDFFMREIRGQRTDGTLISGVPVFRELYNRTGIGWLLVPTAWPIIRPLTDCAYSLFARLRYAHRKNKICTTDICRLPES